MNIYSIKLLLFMSLKWAFGTRSIDVNCIKLAQVSFLWRTSVKTIIISRSPYIK